jgi:hypothetical protein
MSPFGLCRSPQERTHQNLGFRVSRKPTYILPGAAILLSCALCQTGHACVPERHLLSNLPNTAKHGEQSKVMFSVSP